MTFFDRGEARFASAVGVRMHGWTSRERSPYSYRLYFRPLYGAAAIPGHLLADELDSDPRVLVVKRDVGIDAEGHTWLFADAMAFDIGRALGVRAPAARPVGFSINGLPPEPYTLEERIDGDFLERHFGHRDFDRVRSKYKDDDPEAALVPAENRWLDDQPAPLTVARAAERYDVERATTSLLTALLAGTGDPYQDAMIRDRRGQLAGGRWTFVLWDMDWSFRDYPGMSRFSSRGDLIPYTLDPPRRIPGPLQRLLGRLLREDPAYRAEVLRRLVEALNHQLDAATSRALVDRYRALATRLELPQTLFLDLLDDYFSARPDEIYAQAVKYLAAGPPQTVEVTAPEGSLRIDGHAAPARFHGVYPRGLSMRLEVIPERRATFLGWSLDDGAVTELDPDWTLAVDRPLRINAHFGRHQRVAAPAGAPEALSTRPAR